MDCSTSSSRFDGNLISVFAVGGFFAFPLLNSRVTCIRDWKIVVHWPNLACHQFPYSPQTKNSFYIILMVGGKIKRMFCEI